MQVILKGRQIAGVQGVVMVHLEHLVEALKEERRGSRHHRAQGCPCSRQMVSVCLARLHESSRP